MAGEIHHEPFSLSFQGSSIHSGSISFGRFEKEGLSWEKRSSFSHNRYLEEVDKCSKPGSVTEMKAHFEAHFKKKGIRFPASLESQTWGVHQTGGEPDDEAVYATESFEDYRSDGSFSENTSQSNSVCNYSHEQEKCGQGKSQCVEYDEESVHCVSYDEILVNSDEVVELDEEEGGADNRTLAVPVECKDLGILEMPKEIEIQDSASVEEMGSRLDEHVPKKPSDATETPSSSSSSSASRLKSRESVKVKPISPHDVRVTKAFTKRHDVTPKANSMKTKGSSLSSNSKTNVDAKSQKESRTRKTIESQPKTSKKTETRTPIATNRLKTSTNSSKLQMSTGSTSFRFKCSERAEKRKEFYMKVEEKIHAKKTETNQVQAKTQQKAEAEMKQFRKSLNFKATPMPSFYNTSTRPGSHNKREPSKVAPLRSRPATSASMTNRAVTRVSNKHGCEEAKMVKVMVSNRQQRAAKDSDLQKGNLMAVEMKQKISVRRSGN
ncbi:PREDICTED: protein WVD2-like 7 [Camelina sativa]|uniref:Protein WVD2-like 7 n=1 Tax=Camelina sativa TaxID=90675 RepID=A0ABM0TKX7_CAMSA|nr:PREDICTED: protein WVD2-like 7 [Camelina sativa]